MPMRPKKPHWNRQRSIKSYGNIIEARQIDSPGLSETEGFAKVGESTND